MGAADVNTVMEILADHLKNLINEQGGFLFREVRILYHKDPETGIFECLPDLTQFPAAVIVSGDISCEAGWIDVALNVIFLEQTYGVAEKEKIAQDHWNQLFESLGTDAAGTAFCLDSVPFLLKKSSPVANEKDFLIRELSLIAKL